MKMIIKRPGEKVSCLCDIEDVYFIVTLSGEYTASKVKNGFSVKATLGEGEYEFKPLSKKNISDLQYLMENKRLPGKGRSQGFKLVKP